MDRSEYKTDLLLTGYTAMISVEQCGHECDLVMSEARWCADNSPSAEVAERRFYRWLAVQFRNGVVSSNAGDSVTFRDSE